VRSRVREGQIPMTTTTHPRQTASARRARIETMRVLALVAVLCTAALGAIVHLNRNAEGSTGAVLRLSGMARNLQALQDVPFRARPQNGGTPALARTRLRGGEQRVLRALGELQQSSPPAPMRPVPARVQAYFRTLHRIYLVGTSPAGYGPRADRLGGVSGRQLEALSRAIDAAGAAYAGRARRAHDDVLVGSGMAIVLLFCAFAFFQRRSGIAQAEAQRLAEENGRLLGTSREEARTDALTGLPNRRALIADLAAALAWDEDRRAILILFDLDGFKQYNDAFGHPAGDLLLQRLGRRLLAAVAPLGGTAYRMGGDEFCVLAPAEESELTVWASFTALSERGDAFQVGASYGIAELPADAASVALALHIADVRMYDDKASGRPSADRQSTDVLMALITERGTDLLEHVERVAHLTELTAHRMGLSDAATRQAALAARLHDVGKAAIPDAIVTKPGSLDSAEWEFIHRHTVIGEHIIAAAPALVPVAEVVRASHERFDGTGYPDGLRGEIIPVGARIISVCDAYDTMTSDSVYQSRLGPAEAVAELRRNAGTQFDPHVVDAFCAISADQIQPADRHAA
jgi:diguanylate cyclase (GGDEF)-like protein